MGLLIGLQIILAPLDIFLRGFKETKFMKTKAKILKKSNIKLEARNLSENPNLILRDK